MGHELKTKVCSGLLESLATLATTEVKKNGIFTIPGLCRIKTRLKPATKAGIRMAFGVETKCKAKQPGPSSRPSQFLHSRSRSERLFSMCAFVQRPRDLLAVGIPRLKFGQLTIAHHSSRWRMCR